MDRSALLITILLSLACGIAANLGTPLLKTLYLRGLFTTQKRTIRRIKGELALTDYYLNNPNALYLYLFKELFRIIFWVLLAMAGFRISDLNLNLSPSFSAWGFRLSLMALGFALGRASANISFTRSLMDSEDYKKQLLAKLATLESTLKPAQTPTQLNDGQ